MTTWGKYPPTVPNLPGLPTPPAVSWPPPAPPPAPPAPPVVVLPPTTTTKAWIAALGGLLSTFIPIMVDWSTTMPAPWPYVIGLVGWAITTFLVEKVPNKPLAVQYAPPEK